MSLSPPLQHMLIHSVHFHWRLATSQHIEPYDKQRKHRSGTHYRHVGEIVRNLSQVVEHPATNKCQSTVGTMS